VQQGDSNHTISVKCPILFIGANQGAALAAREMGMDADKFLDIAYSGQGPARPTRRPSGASAALGLALPTLLVAFLVWAKVLAGASPTQGGLPAIEGTLVVLLVALTALSAGEPLAVTTLYRLTSYWFVVAVGGLAALWVLRGP
jgi:hypothetical protein